MIDVSLEYVRKVLDHSLAITFRLDGGVVVLNNVVDANGDSPQKNQNKLVVTLVNLEYETSKQFYGGYDSYRLDTKQINRVNPAVCFNLDILISANFDEYKEALKFLTAAIRFFQENIVLTRTNNPTLPDGISALKFEIENTPSTKTYHLWNSLGAKYMPSIVYKIRQVTVDSGQIKSSPTTIQNIVTEASP